MTIEAMKQALEALEHVHRTGDTQVFDICYADHVIPALRAAIEEAEPVHEANEAFGKRQEWWNDKMFEMEAELQRYKKSAAMWRNKAYEAAGHPLPWKPDELWQGLTDKDLEELSNAELGSYDLCLEVEAKLKEKNR